MGNMRYQRTAQRITSAVNCRPLKDWSGLTEATRCCFAMPEIVPGRCGCRNLQQNPNGTAIMAALPTIQRDLALDAGEVMWAVNAYLIASAACIILGGKTADRAGARGAAACGLLLFALASAVIATAVSAPWLLGGRALQGLGAA